MSLNFRAASLIVRCLLLFDTNTGRISSRSLHIFGPARRWLKRLKTLSPAGSIPITVSDVLNANFIKWLVASWRRARRRGQECGWSWSWDWTDWSHWTALDAWDPLIRIVTRCSSVMSGTQAAPSIKASSAGGWVPPRSVRRYFMEGRKWIRRYAGICFIKPETKEVQNAVAFLWNQIFARLKFWSRYYYI